MSYKDAAIEVVGVSKCYKTYSSPASRLRQYILPKWANKHDNARFFWALKNISITVGKGQAVGIVGRNGAGKSTLLQIICGTLSPTTGTVKSAGRIAALLELGSGFNPEFTGKDNVFLYASVLGLTKKEITERYDEIVAFADIGDFINQPLKHYSSGMMMRLAFAVAYCVEPEILVVDEALSVGDAKFQAKCYRKFEELLSNGSTVLLVTHSTEIVVRHCQQAIWIDGGELRAQGEPKTVTNAYLDDLFGAERAACHSLPDKIECNLLASNAEEMKHLFHERKGYNPDEFRWGSGGAEIIDFQLHPELTKLHNNIINADEPQVLRFLVKFNRTVLHGVFGFQIKTPDGVLVYATNTRDASGGHYYSIQKPGDTAVVTISFVPKLVAGEYFLSMGVSEDIDGENIPLDRRFDSVHIKVLSKNIAYGLVDLSATINVQTS